MTDMACAHDIFGGRDTVPPCSSSKTRLSAAWTRLSGIPVTEHSRLQPATQRLSAFVLAKSPLRGPL